MILERLAPETPAPELPLPGHAPLPPEIQVWRDTAARLVAVGMRRGDEFWVRVPRVGRFVFTARGDRIGMLGDAGVAPETLREHAQRSVLPVALQVAGREVLHASAVESPGGVVAFAATKESGKSTLAYALSRRGYRPWADDALVFELVEGGVRTRAIPFDLRLRPEPAALFERDRRVPVSLSDSSRSGAMLLDSAPLRAVVLLERAPPGEASPDGEIVPLTGGEALAALLEQAYSFSLQDAARKKRLVEQYLGLIARVPVRRLRFASGLQNLPRLVDRLEAFFRELAAGSA